MERARDGQALALVLALVGPVPAPVRSVFAEPTHVLRMATVAPAGTAWAHELRRFAREVESTTAGEVRVKWYFGGIAGDEVEVADRIRRDQLDGVASGGMLCSRLAPSMRALRVLGLFQNRDEAAYVLTRLRPTLDAEFLKSGFVNLSTAGLGAVVLFSREPVRSLADFRRGRYWIWDLDEAIVAAQFPAIGVNVAPLPLDKAAGAFDRGEIDGFLAIPTAGLAFQWSVQARYVADLRTSFISGCLPVAMRAFDELPVEARQAVREAAARLQVRLEDLGRAQDEALLKGLFARQGLRPVPVDEAFRVEFFEAARAARDRLGDKLLPRSYLVRVLELMADYRATHAAR